MLPTHEQIKEIIIRVHSPLISGGAVIRSITDNIESYTHTISADGGFLSADITMKANLNIADEWLAEGLGRHIVVFGPMGEEVWEGYVNGVSINFGNYTIERGKLNDVCNRCSVSYTPIIDYDPESGQPITDTPHPTLVIDDEESKKKYGTWEQIVSGGTLLDDNATYLRDVYLSENKDPAISHSVTIFNEGGSDVILTISCRGYVDWLGYIYNYEVADISTTADDKIQTILTADPNAIISPDLTAVEFNGILVPKWEEQDRSAATIINEIVSLGDIYGNRWLFGLYEDQKAFYNSIPSEIEYYHFVGSRNQKITNLGYGEIPPYIVRPGKFAMIKDVMIGKITNYTKLRVDERVMFIDQVTFTAPAKVDLQCKKVGTYEQLMARIGLYGG